MPSFSFPSLPAGPPSRRNWYQELLEHPECLGDPVVLQEAYDSHRAAFLQKNIDAFTASPPSKPQADQALLAHLSGSKADVSARDAQDVNCMVIWARPPPTVLGTIKDVQARIRETLGDEVWLVPEDDIHLSVLELSHRHSVDHLRGVLREIGTDRIKAMLDVPSTLDKRPALVNLQLGFDKLGFALSVVPAAGTQFTYHHLRADLQHRALESGIEIDTCYTALSAHLTIARFVSNGFLRQDNADEKFLSLVGSLNKWLRDEHWGGGSEGDDPSEWRVDSLELQLGYVKFGRDGSKAETFSEIE